MTRKIPTKTKSKKGKVKKVSLANDKAKEAVKAESPKILEQERVLKSLAQAAEVVKARKAGEEVALPMKFRESSEEVAENSKPLLSPEDVTFIPDFDPNITVEENQENVLKNPGLQARFLMNSADEVLFSGGRGSGKSTAFIMDPLRFCGNKNFRGLIIRKAMPDLRELIARCKEMYRRAYPGTVFKAAEKIFVFPSGAKIEFGYCESLEDLERYRGQEYTWVGIDEVAQYPGSWIIDRIKASMRSTDPSLPIQLRCTCNPLGSGRGWVKERWVDKGEPEELVTEYFETDLGTFNITRTWFHSTVRDNKALLAANPNYIASLASHSNETVRKQELDGSWDAVEGQAFPEFRKEIHVVDDFQIPQNWYRWRACDYGYSSMGVCLWLASDWDNNIYVYRELATTLVNVEDFAIRVKEAEYNETVSIGYLDGSLWSRRGEIGEAPADTMMRIGVRWTPADRSPGSRKSSKLLIHKYLKQNEDTEQPRLKILSSCTELIKELSTLQSDPHDPEDIDRSRKASLPDHAYDALRYGVQAMPETAIKVPDPFLDSFVEKDQSYEPIFPGIGI